jgi:hypothetical protein
LLPARRTQPRPPGFCRPPPPSASSALRLLRPCLRLLLRPPSPPPSVSSALLSSPSFLVSVSFRCAVSSGLFVWFLFPLFVVLFVAFPSLRPPCTAPLCAQRHSGKATQRRRQHDTELLLLQGPSLKTRHETTKSMCCPHSIDRCCCTRLLRCARRKHFLLRCYV